MRLRATVTVFYCVCAELSIPRPILSFHGTHHRRYAAPPKIGSRDVYVDPIHLLRKKAMCMSVLCTLIQC